MGRLRDCEIMCFSLKHFTNQFSLYPKHEYEIGLVEFVCSPEFYKL